MRASLDVSGATKVVVVGCGYVGAEAARRLASRGIEVTGVRRSAAQIAPGVRSVRANALDPAHLRRALGQTYDAMIYAVSPDERSDEAYERAYVRGLAAALAAVRPKQLLLVSSTGAMASSDGAWVDENTPLRPDNFTAKRLAEGEMLARRAGGVVLRLGGIYGPGRDRMARSVRDGDARIPEDTVYTNRIHRDDAAEALVHLLALPSPAPVYLGVDSDPASMREVNEWLAARLGVESPAVGQSRRGGASKRCSNARLLRSGFRFRHPTFRSGYAELLDAL